VLAAAKTMIFGGSVGGADQAARKRARVRVMTVFMGGLYRIGGWQDHHKGSKTQRNTRTASVFDRIDKIGKMMGFPWLP
jgi:hypothetical protein